MKHKTILVCRQLAHAFRESLARYRDSHMQRPTINTQKSVCQNLIMGQTYEPLRIFSPAFSMSRFSNLAIYPRHDPMVAASGVCLAGMPWELSPSSSVPCAVRVGPSRSGQHIKDEPCAKKMSITWRSLQPLLKRLPRIPDLVFAF